MESNEIFPAGERERKRERERGALSVMSVLREVPIERKLKIDVKNANRSIAHLLKRAELFHQFSGDRVVTSVGEREREVIHLSRQS